MLLLVCTNPPLRLVVLGEGEEEVGAMDTEMPPVTGSLTIVPITFESTPF